MQTTVSLLHYQYSPSTYTCIEEAHGMLSGGDNQLMISGAQGSGKEKH